MQRDKVPEGVQVVESNRVCIIWIILGQEDVDPVEGIDSRCVSEAILSESGTTWHDTSPKA